MSSFRLGLCSAYMKGNIRVVKRFLQYGGRLNISAVTLGELFTWASRTKASPKRIQSLLGLLNDLNVLPVDDDVARTFGELAPVCLTPVVPCPDWIS